MTTIGATSTTVTVAAQPAAPGDCGLCLRPSSGLGAAVVVSHGAGGGAGVVARFAACEFCERALRRLAAVAPGLAQQGAGAVEEAEDEAGTVVEIHQYPQPVQDGDGRRYAPVAVGAQRADETWTGWLEFREVGGPGVLRTNRETTQSNQGALVYWASGLQPSYLEGAFRRARRPHTVRLP